MSATRETGRFYRNFGNEVAVRGFYFFAPGFCPALLRDGGQRLPWLPEGPMRPSRRRSIPDLVERLQPNGCQYLDGQDSQGHSGA